MRKPEPARVTGRRCLDGPVEGLIEDKTGAGGLTVKTAGERRRSRSRR